MESGKSEFSPLPFILNVVAHQFPANPGELDGARACDLGADLIPGGIVFFPLYSYIIRNAKKWCTSRMAIPEDAAITAYVVSRFNISSTFRFSVQPGADVDYFPPPRQ